MNLNVSLLQLLTLVINIVLPLLVGYVTTELTASKFQAALLMLLTAVTGFVSEWVKALNGHETFNITDALFTWLTGFVAAVAAHYGLWRPTGASAVAQRSLVRSKPGPAAEHNRHEAPEHP
jgi:ABC-type branched-subunit amino acid transport system permease subunit